VEVRGGNVEIPTMNLYAHIQKLTQPPAWRVSARYGEEEGLERRKERGGGGGHVGRRMCVEGFEGNDNALRFRRFYTERNMFELLCSSAITSSCLCSGCQIYAPTPRSL
jgi:hypothetical protein